MCEDLGAATIIGNFFKKFRGDCESCDTVGKRIKRNINGYRQVLASVVGSLMATITLNPINFVKVQIQNPSDALLKSYMNGHGTISISDIIRHTIITRGASGFWSGAGVGLMQSLPSTAIYMSTYERLKFEISKSRVNSSIDRKNSYDNFIGTIYSGLAAALARIVTVSAVAPIELIRTVKTGGSTESVVNIAKSIHKEFGVLGFYRGWASTILRDTPYSIIYWMVFETARPVLAVWSVFPSTGDREVDTKDKEEDEFRKFPMAVNFCSAALSGFVAAVCSHPFDVLKTKQQLSSNANESSFKERSTWKGLVYLYKTKSLFNGLSMRLATVIPAGSVMITVYEAVKHLDL